tara:strand:- start:493 stop:1173 length:681 start_codon:yes stop_codon:yes gene_type:complete
MIIKQKTHKGIKFLFREGTSDEKTFDEVIVRNVYEKKYFTINRGEHWLDLGGNVGAFALLALSKGATVDIYEPDPFNCKMIEKNLKINNYDANIHQKAIVASDKKKMTMYVGNNQQVWRNSLYKNWGNQKFTVDCVHFSDVITKESNVKMDIEGAEMDILEAMDMFPNKMVFEWSFDVDISLTRYREVLKKMKNNYNFAKGSDFNMAYVEWQKSWFPPCTNVYCYE